jgi:hypothetical protein
MPPDRGAIVLAGGLHEGVLNPDLVARVEAARAAVAAHEAGIDQDGIIDDTDPALAAIVDRLRQQPDTGAFWNEGWAVAVADLTRVCSLQQSVASQQAEERVDDVDPDDLVSVAEVTLPAALDGGAAGAVRRAEEGVDRDRPPNLQITGAMGGPAQGGGLALSFAVGIVPSFLQVARHHGRYVLRDGYHRAYGLLARVCARLRRRRARHVGGAIRYGRLPGRPPAAPARLPR